ncbi:MAG: RNA polymerase sigma factor [Verrucomicrobiales bacterium]
MTQSHTESIAPGARHFSTTHWSLILAAQGETSGAHSALSQLCRAYWYPLYAFVRRQGFTPEDAKDLTQDFFVRLIEKDWLDDVVREKGRFRSWLLASMKHFLANEWDRRRALNRGGGSVMISIQPDAELEGGAKTNESRHRTEDSRALFDPCSGPAHWLDEDLANLIAPQCNPSGPRPGAVPNAEGLWRDRNYGSIDQEADR